MYVVFADSISTGAEEVDVYVATLTMGSRGGIEVLSRRSKLLIVALVHNSPRSMQLASDPFPADAAHHTIACQQ